MRHDIVISFRREGGQVAALFLFDSLVEAGYRVAFDLDNGSPDGAPGALERTIEKCRDFIVVLGPGTLDRCIADPDDAFRKEIACAIRARRNIVPVCLPDFRVPEAIRACPDIAPLDLQQGIAVSVARFADAMPRIRGRLLSRPRRWTRWLGIGLGGCLAVAIALAAMYFVTAPSPDSPGFFRATFSGRRALGTAIEVSAELALCENGLIAEQRALVRYALDHPDDPAAIAARCEQARGTFDALEERLDGNPPSEGEFNVLRDTPFDLEVFRGVRELSRHDLHAARRLAGKLPGILRALPDPGGKREFCQASFDLVDGQADLFAAVVMQLMLPVPDDAADFRECRDRLARCDSLPRFAGPWARTRDDVAAAMDAAMALQQRSTARVSRLLGPGKREPQDAPSP